MDKKCKTIQDVLVKAVEEYSDREAVKYSKDGIVIRKTFEELAEESLSIGRMLLENCHKNKTVGILENNSYLFLEVYIGIMCNGGVVVPINRDCGVESVLEFIDRCGIEVLVLGDSYSYMKTELEKKNSKLVIMLRKQCEEEKKKYSGDYLSLATVEPNQVAIILFSSGTTEKSKGIMLTHKNLVSNLIAFNDRLPRKDEWINLAAMPMDHCSSEMMDLLIPIYRGGTICICCDISNLEEDLKLFQPTVLFSVPLVMNALCKRVDRYIQKDKKTQEESIRTLFGERLEIALLGAAKIEDELFEKIVSFGIYCIRGYGLTETSPVISITSIDERHKRGTVGKPLACCQIKIEDGEIMVKGDNVMLGYLNNEEATREVLQEGWLKTGDIGWIDEDGELHVTGRKKSVIVLSNGMNVLPEEIEEKVLKFDFISECIVFEEHLAKRNSIISVGVKLCEDFMNHNTDQKIFLKLYETVQVVNKELPTYQKIRGIHVIQEELVSNHLKKIKRDATITNIVKRDMLNQVIDLIKNNIYENKEITADADIFLELGFDSYELVFILGLLEQKYGVKFSKNDIRKINTIRGLVDSIYDQLYIGNLAKNV